MASQGRIHQRHGRDRAKQRSRPTVMLCSAPPEGGRAAQVGLEECYFRVLGIYNLPRRFRAQWAACLSRTPVPLFVWGLSRGRLVVRVRKAGKKIGASVRVARDGTQASVQVGAATLARAKLSCSRCKTRHCVKVGAAGLDKSELLEEETIKQWTSRRTST